MIDFPIDELLDEEECANAARRALVETCVNPKSIHRVIGYADVDLLDKNNPFSPANRRISIVLLSAKDPQTESPEDPLTPKPQGKNGEL